MTRMTEKGLGLAAGAAILLVAVGIYIPAMNAGFVWDDDQILTDNDLIKSAAGLYRFWFTAEPTDYFPLVSSTLWLEWRIWGMNPAGYHLVNILLHAVSALLVWRVLKQLNIPGAWLAGIVFAVHPVNVESVAWIAQRKNTLPLVLYLLTLLAYLRFEDTGRRQWYLTALGLFLFALLAKTSVVMLPVVLLGTAWWRRGVVGRTDVTRSLPFFALSLVLGLVTVWFQYNSAGAADIRDDSFLSRLAGAGYAVWFYLTKAIAPARLTFVYPGWSLDASDLASYIPAAALAVGFALCWVNRRGWGRACLAGLGYFVVTLLPVLGFLNIYFMRYAPVADHWQYVSIIGPIALMAGAGVHLAGGWSLPMKRAAGAAAAVWVLILAAHTWRHQRIFKDSDTLWRDTLAGNPAAWLAHNNLGLIEFERGKLDEAHAHYEEALRIHPGYPEAHTNLGNLLTRTGDREAAMSHYRSVLARDPDNFAAHFNLAYALVLQDRLDESVGHFSEAVRIDPASESARSGLEMVRVEIDRRAAAR